MGLFVEMLTSIVILVIKSIRDVFLLGLSTAIIVTLALVRLVKAILFFPVYVCWGMVLWTLALASLPFRISNALQKERMVSCDWFFFCFFFLNMFCEVTVISLLG